MHARPGVVPPWSSFFSSSCPSCASWFFPFVEFLFDPTHEKPKQEESPETFPGVRILSLIFFMVQTCKTFWLQPLAAPWPLRQKSDLASSILSPTERKSSCVPPGWVGVLCDIRPCRRPRCLDRDLAGLENCGNYGRYYDRRTDATSSHSLLCCSLPYCWSTRFADSHQCRHGAVGPSGGI